MMTILVMYILVVMGSTFIIRYNYSLAARIFLHLTAPLSIPILLITGEISDSMRLEKMSRQVASSTENITRVIRLLEFRGVVSDVKYHPRDDTFSMVYNDSELEGLSTKSVIDTLESLYGVKIYNVDDIRTPEEILVMMASSSGKVKLAELGEPINFLQLGVLSMSLASVVPKEKDDEQNNRGTKKVSKRKGNAKRTRKSRES